MPKKLLFYVVCPTCEIKIGVHDPKRIGDLIQCPKCSSFVQLDPPEGFAFPQEDLKIDNSEKNGNSSGAGNTRNTDDNGKRSEKTAPSASVSSFDSKLSLVPQTSSCSAIAKDSSCTKSGSSSVSQPSRVALPTEDSPLPRTMTAGKLGDSPTFAISPTPPSFSIQNLPTKGSLYSAVHSIPQTGQPLPGEESAFLTDFNSERSDTRFSTSKLLAEIPEPMIPESMIPESMIPEPMIPEPMIPEPMIPEPMALVVPNESFFGRLWAQSKERFEPVREFFFERWPIIVIGVASLLLLLIGVCLLNPADPASVPIAHSGDGSVQTSRKSAKSVPNVNNKKNPEVSDLPISPDPSANKLDQSIIIDQLGENEATQLPSASDSLGISEPGKELDSLLSDEPISPEAAAPSSAKQNVEVPSQAQPGVEEIRTSSGAVQPDQKPNPTESLAPAGAVAAQAPETSAEPKESTEPTKLTEPLEFAEPTGLDIPTASAGSATSAEPVASSESAESADDGELISDLFKSPDPFAQIDPSETSLTTPTESADSAASENSSDHNATEPSDAPSASASSNLPIAVQKALKVPFASIEIKERTFLQTLQFLGNLGIPLELNWDSLKRMNAHPEDSISYIGESDTAESVLREVLAQQRLTYQWNDKLGKFQLLSLGASLAQSGTNPVGSAVLENATGDHSSNESESTTVSPSTPESASAEARRPETTARYPIADLTDGSVDAMEALTAVIKKYISPDSWTDAGGFGRINSQPEAMNVTQTARVHWELSDFLDRLRIARKQPPLIDPQATKENLALISQRASGILDRVVNVDTEQSIGLNALLTVVSQKTGVPIVLDEAALKRAGVSPEFPMTIKLENEPLNKALDRILEEPGLTYFADTPKSLIVTTVEGVRLFFCVEFYSIGDIIQKGVKPAVLIDSIKKIDAKTWQESQGRGCVDFDPKSDCLVVLQSPDIHLNINKLLSLLRKRWKENAAKPLEGKQ